jgi:hypothetical protein
MRVDPYVWLNRRVLLTFAGAELAAVGTERPRRADNQTVAAQASYDRLARQ